MKLPAIFALLLTLALPSFALADQDATYHGSTSAAENAFVTAIRADLTKRYPTAAAAEKAGYVRYTNADDSGAISYANQQWQSADIRHPSQLWYDKNGRLLGADYSVLLVSSPNRPQLWGVNPGRWVEFDGHIHWVAKDPATGALSYDHWLEDPKFKAAGGNPEQPSAQALVAAKKVAAASDVVTVFHFPSLWDLIVWVIPNPSGAFADKNPLVKP
jgi:type II secretory pathway pseudopilin PulG